MAGQAMGPTHRSGPSDIHTSHPGCYSDPWGHRWRPGGHLHHPTNPDHYYHWRACWLHVRQSRPRPECPELITECRLVLNTIAGEVVEPIQRTALFGQLQGSTMLGVAIGFLSMLHLSHLRLSRSLSDMDEAGGIVGDTFGIITPFETAFFLLSFSSVCARLSMPYISPESLTDSKKPAGKGISAFFEPLKVLVPQKLRLSDGRIVKHRGVLFLCSGVFLGVVSMAAFPHQQRY